MHFSGFFLISLIFVSGICEIFEDTESSSQPSGPIVQLKNGFIRGKITKSWSGKAIYSFLGIRYAQPPTGKLQFKAPQELLESWSGVKNANFDGNKCPQLTFPERKFQGEEDCLYLNVYTSKLPNKEEPNAENLKVLFFLHGGGFTFGSGISEEYGPDYLLDHDMILVIPNYRLGPYGFLSMGDEDLPGNLGLLDQQLALKWVRDNIGAFGGDPDSITLGGSQAGAVSAHIHALTPSSHGLFSQGIGLCGTALTSWGVVYPDEAKERALKLAELLECGSGRKRNESNAELTSTEIMSCISMKEVKDVIWKSQFVLDFNTDFTFPFVPVVYGYENATFLREHPSEMLAEGSFVDVPWIVGTTSLPGLPHALQILVSSQVAKALNEHFEYNLPVFLDFRSFSEENIIEAGRRIKDFYSFERSSGPDGLETMGKVFSDIYYFHPLMETIKAYSSKNSSPLYAYHFSYNYRARRRSMGLPQGDDIAYLFSGNHYIFQLKKDEPHVATMEKFTELIWSFIETGHPTEKASGKVTWEAVKDDNVRFLNIGQKKTTMMNETGLYSDRMAFWDGIFDLLENEAVQQKDEL
ncbi:esterase E4-like [Ischnura elegans]|uniref:esterase E4-like n=1 Tax=Ischnura elegans TaxID=197161 RepID=UPI001ED8BB45|nr:esterase E4-like [Ischnura elegans]